MNIFKLKEFIGMPIRAMGFGHQIWRITSKNAATSKNLLSQSLQKETQVKEFRDPQLPITTSPQDSGILSWVFEWDMPPGLTKVYIDIRESKIVSAINSLGESIHHNGQEYVVMK